MKQCLSALFALCLLLGCAAAETTDAQLRQWVQTSLTEVYNYLSEEATAFEMQVDRLPDVWELRYDPPNHPEWVYTADYDPQSQLYSNMASPFVNRLRMPGGMGENGLRHVLQEAKRAGWFTAWDEPAREAMQQWMAQWGVTPTFALVRGFQTEAFSAGNALHELFASCFGEPLGWSEALTQWRDAELAALGLTMQPIRFDTAGIVTYSQPDWQGTPIQVVYFYHEVPEDLPCMDEIFAQGYDVLCGAYTNSESIRPVGLIAVAKDGQTELAWVQRDTVTKKWELEMQGAGSVLQNREFSIAYDENFDFDVVYPVSATERETYTISQGSNVYLRAYSRQNDVTGEGIHIDILNNGFDVAERSRDGSLRVTHVEKGFVRTLNAMDIANVPTSLEQCHEQEEPTPPQGYAAVCGVHLRKRTSSRSKDLGDYKSGALVQVLGEVPGDPYKWYHVRVGDTEGYMSSIYVDYEGSPCVMKPLVQREPLPIGTAKKAIRLKNGTGLFAKTVTELAEGTQMHVMAQCGSWLHVVIPQGPIDWMMDVDGTYGYVKADDIAIATEYSPKCSKQAFRRPERASGSRPLSLSKKPVYRDR